MNGKHPVFRHFNNMRFNKLVYLIHATDFYLSYNGYITYERDEYIKISNYPLYPNVLDMFGFDSKIEAIQR